MTVNLEALCLAIITLSGWLVALALFGCYRAMRGVAHMWEQEVARLRASHDERLAQLRAERATREEQALSDQIARYEQARRAVGAPAASRYGGVSRW